MSRNLVIEWVEHRNPIDLMDCTSNMEIGLHWYKKGINNKWTRDLTNHLMIDLKTIIAIASMPYIIDFDSYELQPGDEKLSTTLIKSMLGFYVIHMMRVHYYTKICAALMLMIIFGCYLYMNL